MLGASRRTTPVKPHSSAIPDFADFAGFALIVQNVLAFAGMEVNAVYA